MQYAPARRALAGSVLVLGSVGTVSAVHLDSATVPAVPDGGSSAAMAPPMVPDTWPTIPDLRTPSVEEPTPDAPTHGDRRSSRRSSGSADRPVTTRDLIDMAHGARGEDSVVVPVHGVEPSVPLRSTPGIAHLDVLGVGLRDVLDPDDVHTSDRGQRTLGGQSLSRGFDASYDRSDDHNADYQRYGYVRSDFGYERSTAGYDRSAVGYHRAYTSYDTTDVSFSRPRCGRHRA